MNIQTIRSILLGLIILLSVGDAQAYRFWLETSAVDPLEPGESLAVEVHLDTEGDEGATWFSVSVVYPPNLVAYDRAASAAASYILYSPASGVDPSVYMLPPGEPNLGPKAWPLASDQVNIDFIITGAGSPQPTRANESDKVVATLEFDAIDSGAGNFDLSISRPGNTFVTFDSTNGFLEISPAIDLGASLPIVVAPAVPAMGTLAISLTIVIVALVGRRFLTGAARTYVTLAATALAGAFALATLSAPVGFAAGGSGSGTADTDSDGVVDTADNCTLFPNGAAFCNQLDIDMDGYGNGCDNDQNNDGAAGMDDILGYYSAAGGGPSVYDQDCDGAVGILDFARLLDALATFEVAGPSGLSCAGTSPCP